MSLSFCHKVILSRRDVTEPSTRQVEEHRRIGTIGANSYMWVLGMNSVGAWTVPCAKGSKYGYGRKDGDNAVGVPRSGACIGWKSPERGASADISGIRHYHIP